MATKLVETNDASERQRKLIQDVNEIDRLRNKNLSKQRTLRESIQDALGKLETEFANLTQKRNLKDKAFSQLSLRQNIDVAIGDAVLIHGHDRRGISCFPQGVVTETWHKFALVTLDPDSYCFDDFEGKWTGPICCLSLVKEDHIEELTMPEDPYRDVPF